MTHDHSHPDPSHSHDHDHASHSHDGVPCGGHGREPTAEELAAHRAEKASFDKVLASFYYYETHSLSANNRRRKDLLSLPKADQDLLAKVNYRGKLADVDEAIRVNADFLREIADTVGNSMFGEDEDEDEDEDEIEDEDETKAEEKPARHPFDGSDDDEDLDAYYEDLDTSDPNPPHHGHSHSHDEPSHGHSHSHEHAAHSHGGEESSSKAKSKIEKVKPTDFDMDKMRSTLKQFVRDWSAMGKPERDASYLPMLEALKEHYKDVPIDKRSELKVLNPGTGLGRLAWDIAKEGFASQGNEFSHFMLLGSFFILNRTSIPDYHTIQPYVHSFSNHTSRASMLREITLPDVDPSSLPEGSDFSLVAGDFLDVYGTGDEDSEWDAVLTCFFIDTAKNLADYLRTIHRILKPNGIWINLGPLLWHFENNTTKDVSIELSLDEVKTLCEEVGLRIEKSSTRTVRTTYTGNGEGMLRYEYQAEFWTATKI